MLTEEQIAAFGRDGYVVVRDLIEPKLADRFLAHEQAAHPERAGQSVLQTHRREELWEAFAKHPNIAGGAEQILGGRPMIVQTMYLKKPPGGVGIPLHQDTHYLPNEPNTLMACWIALTDTGGHNGGFTVVPGSHAGPLLSAHPNTDLEEGGELDMLHVMRDRNGREWTHRNVRFQVDIPRSETVALEIPRCGGVFFHGMLVHGSYANRSAESPRLAWAVHYVREDSWLFRSDVQDPMPAR